MEPIVRGTWRARLARTPEDRAAALALRQQVFRAGDGGGAPDADRFDPLCDHVLIEDQAGAGLRGCFRLLPLPRGGAALSQSYSAQFYDLSRLAGFAAPMAEVGRFCLHPAAAGDPDVLRLAWGAVARLVDGHGTRLLFGCSSFQGTDPAPHAETLALLAARHLAPAEWRPGPRAPEVIRFADAPTAPPDLRRAQAGLPPLLRFYLAMGGWVSDHAVIDRDLNTLHVFTALDIGRVPEARARALRAVAATPR